MSRRVLLVGAGAVGQVYGHHLMRGGASVAFLVKPKYAAECRRGLTLYCMNARRRRTPVAFRAFEVSTSNDEVRAGGPWDEVWLCIASTALRGSGADGAEHWLDGLFAAMGDAVLVSLQPGPLDRAYILERLGAARGVGPGIAERRFVQGVITFSSWQAPLATERLPRPGIAYWFPPLSPSPFRGPEAEARAVVETLIRGGCPAAVRPEQVAGAPFASAVLMAHVAALEVKGWSWRALARDRALLDTATRAAREGIAAIARHEGMPRPGGLVSMLRPSVSRLLLRFVPHAVPFDIETFFAWHFTKVGEQTLQHLRTLASIGRAQDVPVDAVVALSSALERARAAPVAPTAR